MIEAREPLENLQKVIAERNDAEWPSEDWERLTFMEKNGLFHVEFFGSPFEESFADFLGVLRRQEVAAPIRSLMFRGPDEGSNGTRNWDFTPLLESDTTFPNLASLFIEPTRVDDHNQTILGQDYDEEGILARLLARMPALISLTTPSAPDASFFQGETHPLAALRVDSGYDHQNFIRNLSCSSRFPRLHTLDFGEFNQRYLEEYPESCTPFEHYAELFASKAFAGVRTFRLRNGVCSLDQLLALKALRQDLSFFVIQEYGTYIR